MCCKDKGPATGGTGVCEFGVRAVCEFLRPAVSVAEASGVSVPDAEVTGVCLLSPLSVGTVALVSAGALSVTSHVYVLYTSACVWQYVLSFPMSGTCTEDSSKYIHHRACVPIAPIC